MNDSLILADNIHALDSILSQVTLINYNTDGTLGWTPYFEGVAFAASIVTIFGIFGVWKWYNDSKISRKQKINILEDIIRHLFVNIAIVEILRDKLEKIGYSYGYPDEGIFRRLAFLPEDCNFHRLSDDADMYGTMHEMELLMRNYGVSAEVACTHFINPDIDEQTRKDNLEDLVQRSVKLIYETEKLTRYFKASGVERRKILKHNSKTTKDIQTEERNLCSGTHTLTGEIRNMLTRFCQVIKRKVRTTFKFKSEQAQNKQNACLKMYSSIGDIVAERYKDLLDPVGEIVHIKHYPEVVKLMHECGAELILDKYITYRITDKHLSLIPFPK